MRALDLARSRDADVPRGVGPEVLSDAALQRGLAVSAERAGVADTFPRDAASPSAGLLAFRGQKLGEDPRVARAAANRGRLCDEDGHGNCGVWVGA